MSEILTFVTESLEGSMLCVKERQSTTSGTTVSRNSTLSRNSEELEFDEKMYSGIMYQPIN